MKPEDYNLATLKQLADEDGVDIEIGFGYSRGVGGVLYVVTVVVDSFTSKVESVGQDINMNRALWEAIKDLRDELRDDVETPLEGRMLAILNRRT